MVDFLCIFAVKNALMYPNGYVTVDVPEQFYFIDDLPENVEGVQTIFLNSSAEFLHQFLHNGFIFGTGSDFFYNSIILS